MEDYDESKVTHESMYRVGLMTDKEDCTADVYLQIEQSGQKIKIEESTIREYSKELKGWIPLPN